MGNSIVNISGGSVGTELFAFGDSVVNLSNGSIGDDFHSDDLQTGKRPFLKIAGGSIGNRAAIRDTDVSMSGGQIGNDFLVAGSSVFNMSGGTIGTGLFVSHNAVVKISGGIIGSNFRVDSNGSGKSPVVQISGGLFDGMIADSDSIVHISGGTFNAYETGWISSSKTYITGGTFGANFQQSGDTLVYISGGTFGNHYTTDGETDIVDGTFGSEFTVGVEGSFYAGNRANISGGTFGHGFQVDRQSTANISGGTFGIDFDVTGGSKVNLFGSQFVLGGTDITSTLTPNVPFTVTSRNILLTGILADGTPFDFDLRSDDELNRDYFATNAVLTITLITTNLGDFNRDSTVNAADYTVGETRAGHSWEWENLATVISTAM